MTTSKPGYVLGADVGTSGCKTVLTDNQGRAISPFNDKPQIAGQFMARMEHLLKRLHDEEQVQGVTVFRGISGFGKSGKLHSSSLLDMSLDLPLVIEFFDVPEKVDSILEHIRQDIEPGHIVSWAGSLVV